MLQQLPVAFLAVRADPSAIPLVDLHHPRVEYGVFHACPGGELRHGLLHLAMDHRAHHEHERESLHLAEVHLVEIRAVGVVLEVVVECLDVPPFLVPGEHILGGHGHVVGPEHIHAEVVLHLPVPLQGVVLLPLVHLEEVVGAFLRRLVLVAEHIHPAVVAVHAFPVHGDELPVALVDEDARIGKVGDGVLAVRAVPRHRHDVPVPVLGEEADVGGRVEAPVGKEELVPEDDVPEEVLHAELVGGAAFRDPHCDGRERRDIIGHDHVHLAFLERFEPVALLGEVVAP